MVFSFKSNLFQKRGEKIVRIQNISWCCKFKNIIYFNKNDYANLDKFIVKKMIS